MMRGLLQPSLNGHHAPCPLWESGGAQGFKDRVFIVVFPIQSPPRFLLLDSTPLFEEEGHSGIATLPKDRVRPGFVDRSCPMTALTADYYPMDFSQVDFSDILEKGLN